MLHKYRKIDPIKAEQFDGSLEMMEKYHRASRPQMGKGLSTGCPERVHEKRHSYHD